jgi:pyrimidine operon attenuation protein/uracil phosphoribosyltransferase
LSRGKTIIKKERFQLTIDRLCHELIENYGDFENTAIIGIQERGALLSDRILNRLVKITKKKDFEYGKLDITFYRDDFRTSEKILKAANTEIDFFLENKNIILIDDVLYTGRTVQAALAALQDFGRPAKVELLSLVDRRFNRDLPIQADYQGITIDAVGEAYVKVEWEHIDGEDKVVLLSKKRTN